MAARYRTAEVLLTVVGRRLRFEVRSPLFCTQMQGPVRNHGTLERRDLVWLRVFRTRAAVERFWRRGKPLRRVMQLSTLYYDTCDFALKPPPRRRKRAAA
jgi:hypothetical protein